MEDLLDHVQCETCVLQIDVVEFPVPGDHALEVLDDQFLLLIDVVSLVCQLGWGGAATRHL